MSLFRGACHVLLNKDNPFFDFQQNLPVFQACKKVDMKGYG